MRFNKFFNELFEFPLARDSRVHTEWTLGKKQHTASLAGAPVVKFTWTPRKDVLPAALVKRPPGMKARPEPRAPESSDVNVLLRLLTLNSPIKIEYVTQLAAEVFDNQSQAYYVASCIDALRLWQMIDITWPKRQLGPPIEKVEPYGKKGYIIYLNEKWVDACRCGVRTTKAPPLPLPMQSTPQSMVLHTWWLGSKAKLDINKFFYRCSGNKRGMKHRTPHIPFSSWKVVEAWYARMGGHIDHHRMPYAIVPSKTKKARHGYKEVTSKHFAMKVSYPKPQPRGLKQEWVRRSDRSPLANA